MCIPIDLDVPVLTTDGVEIGIAREILCACPHEEQHDREPLHFRRSTPSDDLWLRASRPLGLDLYIPFSDIAETRPDGVRLRLTADETELRCWDDVPADLPTDRAVAV